MRTYNKHTAGSILVIWLMLWTVVAFQLCCALHICHSDEDAPGHGHMVHHVSGQPDGTLSHSDPYSLTAPVVNAYHFESSGQPDIAIAEPYNAGHIPISRQLAWLPSNVHSPPYTTPRLYLKTQRIRI